LSKEVDIETISIVIQQLFRIRVDDQKELSEIHALTISILFNTIKENIKSIPNDDCLRYTYMAYDFSNDISIENDLKEEIKVLLFSSYKSFTKGDNETDIEKVLNECKTLFKKKKRKKIS